jgi:hypothetical protein
MNHLTAANRLFAAIACIAAPASAHHSMSMFDASKEILIEGTVARLDWTNPHMYLYVDAKGPDGKTVEIEGEGLGITQAMVDGLRRDGLKPGMQVVVRANPNRRGWPEQIRVLDVTSQDGEIHPFYAANRRTRVLTPAESLAGHWAPNRAALGAAFGAMAQFPISPAGREAQKQMGGDGLCIVEPIPFLSVLDELRTIEVGKDEVVLRFDNTGDHVVRTVHMASAHPADVRPTPQGHSIGRWEGETLVIDTIAFEPSPSGIAMSVPSSPGKHTVERLTLDADKTRLRYEITVEDPVYLSTPATLAQQWDHRPDLEFSQDTGACDPEVSERYKNSLLN